jgi:hypothetical protein
MSAIACLRQLILFAAGLPMIQEFSGIDSHKPGLLLSMRQQKRQSSGLQNI